MHCLETEVIFVFKDLYNDIKKKTIAESLNVLQISSYSSSDSKTRR